MKIKWSDNVVAESVVALLVLVTVAFLFWWYCVRNDQLHQMYLSYRKADKEQTYSMRYPIPDLPKGRVARAELAADGVYTAIVAHYCQEDKREAEDGLWWVGTLIMEFVGTRRNEDFGESTKLLQKILVNGGCPDGAAGGVACMVILGWPSKLYAGDENYTHEDLRAYNAYFSRLFKRLTADYGKAATK